MLYSAAVKSDKILQSQQAQSISLCLWVYLSALSDFSRRGSSITDETAMFSLHLSVTVISISPCSLRLCSDVIDLISFIFSFVSASDFNSEVSSSLPNAAASCDVLFL